MILFQVHGVNYNHGLNMSAVFWRCMFYSVVFSFVVTFLDIRTDATVEGSSMGYLSLPHSHKPAEFPDVVHVSDIKVSNERHAAVSRRKRNIFFPSGVKLCAQDTAQQVLAHHLSYFHLRVCQETIWEAFKIFWERLPDQEEYQSWMNKCQENTITVREIGAYFSESDEHQALVKKRLSYPSATREPTGPWQHMCSTPTPDTAEDPQPEDTANGEEEEEVTVQELDNDIAVESLAPTVLEQVVELSILLTGEVFSDSLDDPDSLQFQTLSGHLAEKIEDALEGLPGFKSVTVLDFRPQKDTQGLDGVIVDYAVTLVVDGAGVSSDQLDYLTLQSNRVENSYRQVVVRPTVTHAISEVKTFDTEALHNKELHNVSEDLELANDVDAAAVDASEPPEAVLPEVDAGDVSRDDILAELSETNTVATEDNKVTLLEENTVATQAPVPITSAPDAESFEEEDLLLDNAVQTPAVETPAVETPPPEVAPAEPPSPDLPESFTLPEPPVEVEGSGSGDLEDLLQPTVPPEAEVVVEEHGLMTPDVTIDTDATLEAETDIEVAAVEESTTAAVDEEHLYEEEIPEELEIPIIASPTTEEEGLPTLVPNPEAVDVVIETTEPASEAGLLPVENNSVENTEEEPDHAVAPSEDEDNSNEPVEDADVNVLLTNLEGPVLEERNIKDITASEGENVKEETLPKAPVAVSSQESQISTEDLTEDEILLVNQEEPELPVTDLLSPPQPTSLSPERESPFTRISDIQLATEGQHHALIPTLVQIQTTSEGLDEATIEDQGYDLINYGYGLINQLEEGSTGFPSGVAHGTDQVSLAMPGNPGRALMVFFSLRVTNMIFSDDLFNKSSPEYKALEQRFLELLVPYLQSNLSNFENLEILNFRNGSIVVNSRMKFGKPVQQGVATTVHLILEDFCNTAYQTMNLAIDKYSLDVESGDQADPCKFQACNEYAECKVNKWSGEAECVCNAGYFSMDGLPCQSICELQADFCLNDGKCDIIPGQGAICRCRVGENWWYRGEHCEEYVSEPLVVGIAIASVAGFLLVASGVIFFLARTLRDQYDKDESEDPIRHAESLPSLERATKYNPMYESEATTGYSHYYRRYPEVPVYSSASAEASTDFSSEEMRHIYENSELTKEEIQDRIRIIELYAKDRQFADFVRQHQAVMDTCREGSST